MINLRTRTEYSFRYAYGKIKDIITNCDKVACITDRYTTFGHVAFWKECKKQGKKCILGVELAFVENAKLKVRQTAYHATLIAKNQNGLARIYELTSKASLQKYYYPRLSFEELRKVCEDDVIIIFENSFLEKYLINRMNTYYGISPMTAYGDYKRVKGYFPIVAISNNLYDESKNKYLYQIILGMKAEYRVEPAHLLNEQQWRDSVHFLDEEEKRLAILHPQIIANGMIEDINFEQAQLPKQESDKTLRELCLEGATKRNCNLDDLVYKERLERELDLIKQKSYEEYFLITKDLIDFAKQNMLVGPGRGSSGGSLVCYLLYITEVDPIPFNLIFERFISPQRRDLPDIDIDFQDNKRLMCLDYLKEKYGKECVAKLGTVSKYKPKSLLTELSKILRIPIWEIMDLKENVIERPAGDSRASLCLQDTFDCTEIGKEFTEKMPKLRYSQFIEGHNRHYGQHAAGIVVANKPLYHYCSVDLKTGGCMLDKNDAEVVNLLKLDCLGLTTLTVIQECLNLIGKDRDWIVNYPLDDRKAFDVVNKERFSGIFQFEGDTLKSLTRKTEVKSFEDISALTAIGRPGPMSSGATTRFIEAKNGNRIKSLPGCSEITKDTYGVMIYQEQLMRIVKEVGKMSWEDTASLRKAMAKSYGEDYFEGYYEKFKKGCFENGLNLSETNFVWDSIKSMGKYAFNKAHSVAYAMISYWCMLLKAYYPLEFALATLKSSKDEDKTKLILKELVHEGYEHKIFDKELSEVDWSIKGGKLIGGFINIKKIGKKTAQTLIDKREKGEEWTVAKKLLVYNAETPYDCLFEFREKFTQFYENWDMFMNSKPILLKDIGDEGETVRFLAKTIEVKPRDINEQRMLKKRDGKKIDRGCLKFLDLKFQDDTDSISGRINREIYEQLGAKISNEDKIGSYYLVQGKCCKGFRYIIVKNIRRITELEVIEKINKNSLDS